MSGLDDAIRKLHSREPLTAEESDLIDRYLDARDKFKSDHGGQSLGIEANKMRSIRHKALWMTEARRIVDDWPMMLRDLKAVARQVSGWCERQTPPIRMLSGKTYSETTIYRQLLRAKDTLCAKPSSPCAGVQSLQGSTQQTATEPSRLAA